MYTTARPTRAIRQLIACAVLFVLVSLSLVWLLHTANTLNPELVYQLKYLLVSGEQLLAGAVIALAITILAFRAIHGTDLKHVGFPQLIQACAEAVKQAEVDPKKESQVPRKSI